MEETGPSSSAAGDAASLDYLLRLLHWSGVLRHPDSRSWSARCFYLQYAATLVALFYYCCVGVVLIWREALEDIDNLILGLCLLDTTVMWVFRLGHIAMHEQDFHRLALQVRDDFGQFMAPRDVPLLVDRSRAMRRFVLSYLSLGLCDVTMWLISPVRGEGLPLQLILPFDTSHPVGWAFGWLICAFLTVDCVVLNMMADAFNVSIMAQLRMQLLVLTRNITDLANDVESASPSLPLTPCKTDEQSWKFYTPVYTHYSLEGTSDHYQKKNSSLMDAEVQRIQQSNEPSNSVHYRLKNIILHHQTIIRNVDFLQQCLGGVLLAQSLSLGAAICMLLFQVALSAQGVQETGKICGYLCAMFTELSVYCWFGDQLMSESEKVAFAAYDAVTSLQECPLSVKRSLLLMMHRAQRPLCITAAGFYPLSRESFVAILNVSYSFFAILRNFKEE